MVQSDQPGTDREDSVFQRRKHQTGAAKPGFCHEPISGTGSMSGSIYAMDEETIKERGIDHLPETLGEAIDEFEEDVFLRNVLGDHIFYKYLEAKKEEWNVFRSQVTDWEIGEYLYKY